MMTPYAIESKRFQDAFTVSCYEALVMTKVFLLESERSLFDVVRKDGTDDDMKPKEALKVLKQTEFTKGFLRAIQGDCTGPLPDDLLPVGMSWDYSKLVVDYLSKVTGCNFCIPTEAEWEFTARGGNRSHGYLYSGFQIDIYRREGGQDYSDYAVTNMGSGSAVKTDMQNVASKKPNELGLYDMTGNVWEWCADWYAKYETKSVTNPHGPTTGTMRVYRGGSHLERSIPRVFDRFRDYPDKTYSNVGFRLCLRP